MKTIFPRRRPWAAAGEEGGAEAYQSFPSGHATMAWTAAGVSVVRALGRSEWSADHWSAAASVSLGCVVSVLRVAAGEHYWSDVITGGLIGLLVGGATELLPLGSH
jgi:membrane-associated phospholipid phosphatase